MAKKKTSKKVNKSEKIRSYMEAHPAAKPSEVAAALQKQGIDVDAQYVSVVKSAGKKNKTQTRKRVTSRSSARVVKSDRISVESIIKAKHFVGDVGDLEEARQALDALERLAD